MNTKLKKKKQEKSPQALQNPKDKMVYYKQLYTQIWQIWIIGPIP